MAERREHILGAMERCIMRDGWEGATIAGVASEAGLSKGAVCVHFESKRALLIGMVERNFRQFQALANSKDFPTLRSTILENATHLVETDGWRRAAGILETWVVGIRDPEIRDKLGRGADDIIGLLAGVVRGLCPHFAFDDARHWVLGMLALTNGLAVMRSFDMTISESDLHRQVRGHFDLLVARSDT
jgi:AcrR family transcriptional regulator